MHFYLKEAEPWITKKPDLLKLLVSNHNYSTCHKSQSAVLYISVINVIWWAHLRNILFWNHNFGKFWFSTFYHGHNKGPRLLTRFKINPSMDKQLHLLQNVGWKYFSIIKLQWCSPWCLVMYKSFPSQTLLCMKLLIHAAIKINPC